MLEEKPHGTKLDTNKEDKHIDQFRATKQKFKQTRKEDAMDSNLFKQIDVVENKSRGGMGMGMEGAGDDIDSILQYL